MSSLTYPLPPHRRIVQPILTPRFVPVCSDALLHFLAKISDERGVRVQSHMCESRDQMEWVEGQRGMKDEDVFDQVGHSTSARRWSDERRKGGLLRPGTIQAHVTSLPEELRGRCKERGVTVAHCPLLVHPGCGSELMSR
jgi:guanine deaminase